MHAEGSLTLYEATVVAKDADSKLSVKQEAGQGPLRMVIGAMVGSHCSAVLSEWAIGLDNGAALGTPRNLNNLGVSVDFLDNVSQDLTPGKVADVSGDWVTQLCTRMDECALRGRRRAGAGGSSGA